MLIIWPFELSELCRLAVRSQQSVALEKFEKNFKKVRRGIYASNHLTKKQDTCTMATVEYSSIIV